MQMEGKWKPEEKRVSSLTALSLLLEYKVELPF